METLKLRTNQESRFSRTIIMAGQKISFDGEGVCYIKDPELANVLIEDYGLYKGEKRVEEEKAKEVNKNQPEDVKNDQKDMIPVSALKELQAKCQKLEKEKEAAEEEIRKLETELSEFKRTESEITEDEKEDEDIIKAIQSKTRKELLELCEEMEFPKEEYKNLTAANLKKYMVGKLEEK